MMKPQDIMIGDYVLADGKVVRVDAVHQKKIGFHNRYDRLTWARLDRVSHIRITHETLRQFGFVPISGYSDTCLPGKNRWRLDCQSCRCPDLHDFDLSWSEDEFGDREYRIASRGYGEQMYLPHDSISEMQHFFYQFNHGCTMPLTYREDDKSAGKKEGEQP